MGNLLTVPAINIGPINQPGAPAPTTPPVQVLTCPSDFTRDAQGMCRMNCATGYTYNSQGRCQHNTESTVTYIPGRARPGNQSEINTAISLSSEGATRGNAQAENLRLTRANQAARQSEVTGAAAAAGSLAAGATLMDNQRRQFNDSARIIQNAKNSLRIRRPPVQPETEIPKEQRRIQQIIQKNALFIQIVLVLVLVCAVSYFVLPMETANYVSLAVLSVALIYRFFFIK